MEKSSRDEEITIEGRVSSRDSVCRAQHLSHMLNQAASPSVMYGSGAGRSAKSLAELGQKQFSQAAEPRIVDRFDRTKYLRVISLLLLPQFFWSFKQHRFFFRSEISYLPISHLDPVRVPAPELAFDTNRSAGNGFPTETEGRVVVPYPNRE